jgi:class 3 adenylate cyclase
MAYLPRPVDTSRVKLPPGISKLTERLAENAHEVWAAGRLAEGWSYGPVRDDEMKQHPCLVRYDELPESEKEYDRRAALESLKTILALGYSLEERSPAVGAEAGDRQSAVAAWLGDPSGWDLQALMEIWRVHKLEDWAVSAEMYETTAEYFMKFGEPLLAYDVAAEGMRLWPQRVRLRQLVALSLFRSKATERAMVELQKLYDEGCRDEETMGMLARAHKDLADRTEDPERKRQYWENAYEIYSRAARETGGYYSGINAATLARILGREVEAAELALRVRRACREEQAAAGSLGGDSYWRTATLAESALILNNPVEAENLYMQAARQARNRFGDLASTRRNARLLMDGMGLGPAERARLERCFEVPRVVVFSGHMIDRPGRPEPRFPAHLEAKVKAAVRDRLVELDGRVGFASAACGSDLIFLETVLELGGEIHVVLPYEAEHFIEDSVDIMPGADWRSRFEGILGRAVEVLVASEKQIDGGGLVFDYANRLLLGLAKIRANQLETVLAPLTVWDGGSGDGLGGTASIVELWRNSGAAVNLVDLKRLLRDEVEAPDLVIPAAADRIAEKAKPVAELDTQLKAMLFADAVGFGRLSEAQVALFIRHFLGGVADLTRPPNGHAPLTKDTWGDGLFFVFETAGEAGRFALDLSDMVNSRDWSAQGLPREMNFRIALHAGPVYGYTDPVTGRGTFTGIHVTRAARLEPITPPGNVYASREFAALAAVENEGGFVCDYVGQTPLAKNYGVRPVYHVLRKTFGRRT